MVPGTQTPLSLFGASLAAPASGPPEASLSGAGGALGMGQMAGAAAAGAPPAPFGDLLTDAIGEVQHLEVQAKGAIEGLISGRGVDVHEAMIAAQKAGMGFELMLSVRNKALAAYQQVLGMQF